MDKNNVDSIFFTLNRWVLLFNTMGIDKKIVVVILAANGIQGQDASEYPVEVYTTTGVCEYSYARPTEYC